MYLAPHSAAVSGQPRLQPVDLRRLIGNDARQGLADTRLLSLHAKGRLGPGSRAEAVVSCISSIRSAATNPRMKKTTAVEETANVENPRRPASASTSALRRSRARGHFLFRENRPRGVPVQPLTDHPVPPSQCNACIHPDAEPAIFLHFCNTVEADDNEASGKGSRRDSTCLGGLIDTSWGGAAPSEPAPRLF